MKPKRRRLNSEKVVFFEIEALREHEEIRPDYLEELKNEILLDGMLKMPICIDKKTCIILDGHHRLHALKKLKCKRIPVVLVDYQSPQIKVIPWREGETITKEKVIDTALSGKRMPSKTSKHMIALDGEWKHVSAIQMMINIPLEKLK